MKDVNNVDVNNEEEEEEDRAVATVASEKELLQVETVM